jgi:hypothetical protein
LVTVAIVAGEAAANTSAGAPATICCASVELPPYENVTVVPGWAASNSFPSALNTSVKEDAASTVTVPPPTLDEGEAAGAADVQPPRRRRATRAARRIRDSWEPRR